MQNIKLTQSYKWKIYLFLPNFFFFSQTHIQATYVDFHSCSELLFFCLLQSDLLQQVEIGPGVLQVDDGTRSYSHSCWRVCLVCVCVCFLQVTLMSSLKFLMGCVPALRRWKLTQWSSSSSGDRDIRCSSFSPSASSPYRPAAENTGRAVNSQ